MCLNIRRKKVCGENMDEMKDPTLESIVWHARADGIYYAIWVLEKSKDKEEALKELENVREKIHRKLLELLLQRLHLDT